MANDGATIVSTLQEVALFYRNIRLLLTTSDDLFDRRGWHCPFGSACFWTGTTSLDKPERWIPSSFYRAYTNDENPTVLAYISVLIDLPPSNDDPKKGKVLLSAGGLVAVPANGWANLLKTSESREIFKWHLFRQDCDELVELTPQPFPLWLKGAPKDLGPTAKMVCRALTGAWPLIEITGQPKLEGIVDELIKKTEVLNLPAESTTPEL